MRHLPLIFLAACKVTLGDWWNEASEPPVVGIVTVRPEQTGELGYRNFFWTCVAPTEQTCMGTSGAGVAFPKRVALGARFALTGEDAASVGFAGTRFLRDLDGSFLATNPGTVALYTLDAARLADFIHMKVIAPGQLQLAIDPLTAVASEMKVGASQTVTVVPLADNQPLAGSLDVQWQTSDAAVIAFENDLAGPAKKLRALAPGAVTVTVTAGEIHNDFNFTVVP